MKKLLPLLALAFFFVACGTNTEETVESVSTNGSSTQKVSIFDATRLSEVSIQFMDVDFSLLKGWSVDESIQLQEKDGISKVVLNSPGGTIVMQMNEYAYKLSPMPLMTLGNGILVHQNPCGGALSCHILQTDSALYEVAFTPHKGWPEVTDEDLLQILTSVEYLQ